MWNLKNNINEQTHSENKLMVVRGKEVGGWAKWVKRNGRYRLSVMA